VLPVRDTDGTQKRFSAHGHINPCAPSRNLLPLEDGLHFSCLIAGATGPELHSASH
jgi:hypothetical protein